MVSDLVNIIMFKLYRVSKISHNWYMQMILIRFLQCYQSAFTLNHIFCHTCSLYNMNMHNILHIIYVAYIMPDNIFILIHLKKSYSNMFLVPFQFLPVPQNVPQTYIIVDWYSNKGIFVFRYMFLCSDEILNSLSLLFRVFFC